MLFTTTNSDVNKLSATLSLCANCTRYRVKQSTAEYSRVHHTHDDITFHRVLRYDGIYMQVRSTGSAEYSSRVYQLSTVNYPMYATHALKNGSSHVTFIGSWLCSTMPRDEGVGCRGERATPFWVVICAHWDEGCAAVKWSFWLKIRHQRIKTSLTWKGIVKIRYFKEKLCRYKRC